MLAGILPYQRRSMLGVLGIDLQIQGGLESRAELGMRTAEDVCVRAVAPGSYSAGFLISSEAVRLGGSRAGE